MKSKASFFVIISALLCHLFSPRPSLTAQVPSQLQTSPAIVIKADSQEKTGDLYHLEGHAEIVDGDMHLTADRMDYNEAAGDVVANGNIHFSRVGHNEDIWANRANYNVRDESGKFFVVVGIVGGLMKTRTAVLTTTNPFFFEAERVDRVDSNTYHVVNAKITVCSLPDPTWTFETPDATVHPDVSAVLHHPKLRVLKHTVFYFPYFYRSLARVPRNSGFLSPAFGNSSTLGVFFGDSFFWAINRSMDAEIGGDYLSARGLSERATFRMRPGGGSYLNVSYFGVEDRGVGSPPVNQGGRTARAEGVDLLPYGFRGVLDVNYLSSLTFRQAFTQTYNEAVNSEVHTIGSLTKNFDSLSFNTSFSNLEDFQSTTPNDTVTIHQLPQVELSSVERPLWEGSPLYVSWDASAGLVSRSEPNPSGGAALTTSAMARLEFNPRITLPLHWEGFNLTPTFGYHAQHYGNQGEAGNVIGQALNRNIGDISVELDLPSLSKVFPNAGRLYSGALKHVIEPKVIYRYVTGVDDFADTILFDEGDLLTNTNQLEYSITNRLFAKRLPGSPAQEVLSWELKQQYYFDPTFGNALQPGQRNVFLSTLDFSGNSFLDVPKQFSPIVSILRFRPFSHYDLEFREDYDTTAHRFTNGGLMVNANWGQAFGSVSQFLVRSTAVLSPPSDQIHFTLGYGKLARAGLSAVFTAAYDVRAGYMQYSAFQVSYNNNCCGISVEYRRFALGPVRNENQYRIAFSLANIGTFGNMKKQERLF